MHTQEEAIFAEALQLRTPEDRHAFLEQACGDNAELRSAVESLLAAYDDGEFLESPALLLPDAAQRSIVEGPGTRIGSYKLLEQIGEGGFGVVFMAEQTAPVKRKVALKILKPGMDTKQIVARFEAERQALAMMEHPHIARVFDAGATESGRPYFVMELVKGVPITRYCDEQKFDTRKRLELFGQVCQAVQHAHHKAIIHRDIKPSNVIVSSHDGTPVVKVIDFGIAKAMSGQLTDKTLFTGFVQMLGTPAYMSPEQAGMSDLDVDTRSDIYSLGVLMYELLTGTTPFDKESLKKADLVEIRRLIREVDPPLPSARVSTLKANLLSTISDQRKIEPKKLRHSLRGELDWIVMKSLEKDRNRRYETANAFFADVERYLTDKPVLAYPPSVWYRFTKFARRNRFTLATTLLVAIALLAGTTVSIWQAIRAARAEESAKQETASKVRALNEKQQALQQAERQRQNAQRLSVNLALDRGLALCEEGNISHGLLWLARALELSPDDSQSLQRVIRANLADWHARLVTLQNVCNHATRPPVAAMVFDPDKQCAAVADVSFIRFWDVETGKPIRKPIKCPANVRALAFSPDDRTILVGDSRGTVRFWNYRTRLPLAPLFKYPTPVATIACSPDGNTILTGAVRTKAQLRNVSTGEAFGKPFPIGYPTNCGAFNPSGDIVMTWRQASLFLWDARTTKRLRTIDAGAKAVVAATISNDGQILLMGEANQGVVRYLPEGQVRHRLPNHRGQVSAVAIGPLGRFLLTGSADRTARLWDAASYRPIGQPLEHEGRLLSVAFRPDRQTFLTACNRGSVRLWRFPDRRRFLTRLPHPQVPNLVAIAGRDKRLLTFEGEGWWDHRTVRLWDIARGKLLIQESLPHQINSVAVHPQGDKFAFVSKNVLHLWRITDSTLSCIKTNKLACKNPTSPAFSPDGMRIAIGARGAVYQYDANTLTPVGDTLDQQGLVRVLAFSPDGQTLLAGNSSGSVQLWDFNNGQPARKLAKRLPGLNMAQFTPDGDTVLLGSTNGRVFLFDAETGAFIREALRQHREAREIRISPDGRTVLAVGGDGSARLFDVHTGRNLGAPREHYAPMSTVVFNSDGRFVAVVLPEKKVGFIRIPQPVGGTPERITLWIDVATGMELDEDDVPVLLSPAAWRDRKQQLERLGGPPLKAVMK